MITKLAAQMVQYIAASSALSDRLMGELNGFRTQEKQAADKRRDVLDVLVKASCVAPHQKAAALERLANHGATLDLLVAAVGKMEGYKAAAEKAASELGQPETEKSAGVKTAGTVRDSLNDPYVGRRTSEKKASDLALMAVLSAPSRS
jgi:hypothetical protein